MAGVHEFWRHQPRWPKKTPTGPKGPGAGRWRDDKVPNKPRLSWAEVASHILHLGGLRHHDHPHADTIMHAAGEQLRHTARTGGPHDATLSRHIQAAALAPEGSKTRRKAIEALGQHLATHYPDQPGGILGPQAGRHPQHSDILQAAGAQVRDNMRQGRAHDSGLSQLIHAANGVDVEQGSREQRVAMERLRQHLIQHHAGEVGGQMLSPEGFNPAVPKSVHPPEPAHPQTGRDLAAYPDVPPGLDISEDDWMQMSYDARRRAIRDAAGQIQQGQAPDLTPEQVRGRAVRGSWHRSINELVDNVAPGHDMTQQEHDAWLDHNFADISNDEIRQMRRDIENGGGANPNRRAAHEALTRMLERRGAIDLATDQHGPAGSGEQRRLRAQLSRFTDEQIRAGAIRMGHSGTGDRAAHEQHLIDRGVTVQEGFLVHKFGPVQDANGNSIRVPPRRRAHRPQFGSGSQLAWEDQVRAELEQMGYNPGQVEAHAEGFGQDFAEWQSDPVGYAHEVARQFRQRGRGRRRGDRGPR